MGKEAGLLGLPPTHGMPSAEIPPTFGEFTVVPPPVAVPEEAPDPVAVPEESPDEAILFRVRKLARD